MSTNVFDPTASRAGRRPRAGRALSRVFVPATEDPKPLQRRRRTITPGSVLLSAIITLYGFYATGHLPEGDQLFDHVNNALRARNDVVVNAILAAMPLIGLILFILAVLLYVLFHINNVRQLEDDRTAIYL